MIRRFVVLIVAVVWVAVPLSPARADTGNVQCQNVAVYGSQEYGLKSVSGGVGAKADIEVVNYPLCTGTGTNKDDISGSFGWVGVEVAGSTDEIYQIGEMKCHDPLNSTACNGHFKYFYAWGVNPNVGGCGNVQYVIAAPISLGAATTGTHNFKIYKSAGLIHLVIDTSEVGSFSSNVICWTSNYAAYSSESWDEGDQLGGRWYNGQSISSARYEATLGGVWASPQFPTCYHSGDTWDYTCSRVSGDAIDTWTDRR